MPMLAQAGESLATVLESRLPALAAPVDALLSIEGRPLALGAGKAWLLAPDAQSWQPLDAPSGGAIVGSAGAEAHTFVLRAGRQPERPAYVERLSLTQGRLQTAQLPPLPVPLVSARIAVLNEVLYLVGRQADGQARWLQYKPGNTAWARLADWPGTGQPTSLVAQTAALFLSVVDHGGATRLLRWSSDQGWTERGTVPGRVLSGAGRAIGQAHVLYLLADPARPDGPPRLMSFQTITGSWARLSTPSVRVVGEEAPLSTAWKNGLVWWQPGAHAARGEFLFAEIQAGKHLLRWLDWLVIAVYLAAMLGIGLYFYLREKRNSTSDFFVGGRSIPFWAAGVSLYATNTSSISFIAIPAKAFETNWQYLTNNLIAVVGLMFVAVWIVPLLRRLDLMSVFHYLETRFHPAIRMLASALCILMQVGSRMSVVLFLPALAIATITGLDVVWSILIMGGFTIAYTALGGMKAVVWTDFVQVFAMMGGAIFAIGFIIYQLNGGFEEFWQVAMIEDKTKLFDFSFDLTKATVWGFIFLVLFDVVLTFPKDQVLMQRTLSTKSDKEAGRSIWAFAAIMIPGGFVFYSIGTALFVYYRANPERMNPMLSIDATFPLFIAAELPVGVTGLIIAGIFAAAMSTLSSIINSVATLASVDFYEKLAKNPTPKKSVLFAEIITVAVGLAGIGVALVLSRYDIHSLFDVSIELAGLLGGGFAGAYTLGMFTRRANSQGVAIGIGSSIVLTTMAWSMELVHPYFYLAISILLCIVIGYLASLLFPAPTRSLKGLTIYADQA
ncbi:sodium:solute symporter [Paucibacter sp. PLA-PC-4]|uniref:sodium:solute symporter n=1 Tax=Paucibacter sp. PLA-PC-4 TaxID=2993655 RepID=UPI0022498F01|nr:sodium:solute symporter [Paucibacter sp. PLA-PC-4]MCX2861568.1 sodium:solute symporter [Paucibacter sp. PLA-PC-4]